MVDVVPKLVVVCGPTASGKSSLALELARRTDGEIVNADSMQVYRGMDIGTAKPSPVELAEVPHHLFDLVAPDEEFTAADYGRLARAAVTDIYRRGRVPIVVGGTGLYIRCLLAGLAESPGADREFRTECQRIVDEHGEGALHEQLRQVDPLAAARIHPNNRVRVVRALEVFRQTGRSICQWQEEHAFADRWCDCLKMAISDERTQLYARIDERVDRMINAGLVDEVAGLLAAGYSPGLKSMSAIGYREICGYLQGRFDLAEAVALIRQNTRRYAKRQLTWFRAERDIHWLQPPVDLAAITATVQDFLGG